MKQIKIIEPTTETREDKRIGFYDVVLKSLEDNVNEFLSTIPEEKVKNIDHKKDMCIITYLK